MNISLSEIILVLLIALLVVKPEQMPEAAKAMGRFIRWLQGMGARVKSEVHELINFPEHPNDHQQ